MTGGKIALIFIVSLFMSTFFIAYFDQEFHGSTEVNLLQIPTTMDSFSRTRDLTKSCNISEFKTSGSWACSSNGITGSGSLLVPFVAKSGDGIYSSSYRLSNPTSSDYTIIIADTSWNNFIHLDVTQAGLHIPGVVCVPIVGCYALPKGTLGWDYPLQGASSIPDVSIKTRYNINSNELSIVFNGQTIQVDKSKIPPLNWVPDAIKYSQGVVTSGSITITEISGDFNPAASSDIQETMDGLEMIFNLLVSMIKLCSYTFPYHIIPLQLQIIIIGPQEFAILIGLAMLARGT